MPSRICIEAPLRWGRRFAFAVLALAAPVAAQPTIFATPGLGLAVSQFGMAQPIQDFGVHYQVTLAPEPFRLQANPEIIGDGLMLTIGLTAETFDRFGSASDPLFGPASAYAREPKPGPLYLTDPACEGPVPTGFNILWPDHSDSRGWPVTQILPDRAWVGCTAPGLDPEVDLIRPGQVLYLVLSDGEGADFLVLRFAAPGQS